MVAQGVKNSGYLFITESAGNQAQTGNQKSFANAIQKAEKNYGNSRTGQTEGNKQSVKNEDAVKTDKMPDKQTEKAEKSEKPEKAGNAEETENQESGRLEDAVSAKDSRTDETAADEEMEKLENVNEAIAALVNEQTTAVQQMVAEQLDVEVSQVPEIMEKLGMETSDLQEPEKLLKLIAALKDLDGPQELLTNSQLAETFKNLNADIKELLSQEKTVSLQTEAEIPAQKPLGVLVEQTTGSTEQNVNENDYGNRDNYYVNNNNTNTYESNNNYDSHNDESEGFENKDSQDDKPSENTPKQTLGTDLLSGVQGQQNTIARNIEAALSERVDARMSENIVKQVTEQVKVQIKADVTSLEMQLYPEHLGKVSIQVSSKNGILTAHIAAETEAARAALVSQIDMLRDSMNNQGLKVESVEVMVASRGFEQNNEANEGAKEQHKQGKRSKKAVLDELLEDRTPKEESLKEALGNTVSYTA